MQGGEQGRLLFLSTRWRCLPSASRASCLRAAVPLRALPTLRWGVGRPWKPLPGSLLTTRSYPRLSQGPLLSSVLGPESCPPWPLSRTHATARGHRHPPASCACLSVCPSRVLLLLPWVPGGHSLSLLLAGVKKHHQKSEQYLDGALLGGGGWSFNGQFWFPAENALTLLWDVWLGTRQSLQSPDPDRADPSPVHVPASHCAHTGPTAARWSWTSVYIVHLVVAVTSSLHATSV